MDRIVLRFLGKVSLAWSADKLSNTFSLAATQYNIYRNQQYLVVERLIQCHIENFNY